MLSESIKARPPWRAPLRMGTHLEALHKRADKARWAEAQLEEQLC